MYQNVPQKGQVSTERTPTCKTTSLAVTYLCFPPSQVILPSSNVKSFTQEKPSVKSDSKIKYGKYDLVKPFTMKELRVHFENMKAFKTVSHSA